MKIIFLFAFIFLALSGQEIQLGPQPYIRQMSALSEKAYQELNGQSFEAGSNGFKLEKGAHRLSIRGREPNTFLRSLWLGPANEVPGQTKGGIYLKLTDAKLLSPMQLAESRGIFSPAEEQGEAIFEFELTEPGQYFIWADAYGMNWNSDSFYLRLDDGPEFGWAAKHYVNGKFPGWQPVRNLLLNTAYTAVLPLAWGASSPLSPRKADPEYYRLAIRVLETVLGTMKNVDTYHRGLWYMAIPEALHLLANDSRTSAEKAAEFREAIRPFFELSYQNVYHPYDQWYQYTPNIRIQYAAVMALGAEVFRAADQEVVRKYQQASADALNDAVSVESLGNKPLGYGFGAGIDSAYSSSECMFLSRIHMVTANPLAEKLLTGYATAAEHTTVFGQRISISSPWWKHSTSATPPLLYQLKISRNPAYARMLMMAPKHSANLAQATYYNCLAPVISITPEPPLTDRAYFAVNEKGPALRSGNINIVMPYQGYCESSCGVIAAGPSGILAQVMSIIIAAVDTKGKMHYPGAWTVPETANPQPEARSSVIGGDFIASAVSFRPMARKAPRTVAGIKDENNSPWRRTDIWFADVNGAAGRLELKALQDNKSQKVVIWPYCSDKFKINRNSIQLEGGLSVELPPESSGKIHHLGKTLNRSYPQALFEYVLKSPETPGFKAGEQFSAHVGVSTGKSELKVTHSEVSDNLYSVEIKSGGGKYLLYFNNSAKVRNISVAGNPAILQSVDPTGQKMQNPTTPNLEMPPGSLTVVKYN